MAELIGLKTKIRRDFTENSPRIYRKNYFFKFCQNQFPEDLSNFQIFQQKLIQFGDV